MPYKLGKRPARPNAVKLKIGDYLKISNLPPLPKVFGHEALIASWPMYANDRFGDCVWAGAAHETLLLAKEAGCNLSFRDSDVLSDYAAATGFRESDPSTDNGSDMQAAASYRKTMGIVDANGKRHQIACYVALEPGNSQHLYYASYLFGAVGIGLALPNSALDQAAQGGTWDVLAGSSAAGGHYVPLVGRRTDGLLVTVSWGALQPMTERFFVSYCDEAVAYVSMECMVNHKSPEGFDYDALVADLAAL